MAFTLVAAACGSSGTKKSEVNSGPTTTADPNAAQKIQDNKASGQDTRAGDKPVPGGKLVYGIEADSANPWVHYATSCAISCRMIFKAISDPLFIGAKNGDAAVASPYLLKSATASTDGKQWKFTVRDGIKFHDGSPLDGAAVKYNIDVCRLSGLTGPAYGHIDKVSASGQEVTIDLKGPDFALPFLFRDEVCGYMFSMKWIRTLESNPLRKIDPTQVDPPTGKQTEPVGVGPFKFVSYTAGNGNSLKTAKNPDYWRKAEGLPYLDEVEFVVAVDIQSRSAGLKSGQFNIIHTANSDESAKFAKDKDQYTLLQANAYGETSYTLLNVGAGDNPTYAALAGKPPAMDAEGKNSNSPILNVNCRRALAAGIDYDSYVKQREAGITKVANGPFPPGSLGYLEDTGYPKFDKVKANGFLDTCLKELNKTQIEFTFNTTNDAFNVESNQLIVSMWKAAFGDKVKTSVTPIEQGQYIGLALVGSYNAFGWRNHGGLDPNEQFFWWYSGTASPIGQLALNFGRFQDKDIDTALGAMRATADPAKRKAAAETINKTFGSQVYNIWLNWTLWTIAANPKVRNLTDLPLPDGTGTALPVISGKHQLAQVWCVGGKCS